MLRPNDAITDPWVCVRTVSIRLDGATATVRLRGSSDQPDEEWKTRAVDVLKHALHRAGIDLDDADQMVPSIEGEEIP